MIKNRLIEGGQHIALVISPLKALMADQVAQLQKRNIKAAALMEDTRDIADDESIIFVSPEAATLTRWKRLLGEKFQNPICLLAFDEAHCISSWYDMIIRFT
ncbi:uncharacterized protein LOC110451698 [Mizuhopecten yessoensis]|uniref:uncharacterized protein LOC110451698 n=1 Tax=Mizuhopecten yessoensis TaxID=6573 RepID=UPI000B45F62F|nr:uncharacterized protein LOC110451698 [Mizuhopecten yessoensis]